MEIHECREAVLRLGTSAVAPVIVHLDNLIGIVPVGPVKLPFRLEFDRQLEVVEVILAVKGNEFLELLLRERIVGSLPQRPYTFLGRLNSVRIDKVACGVGVHAGAGISLHAAEFIEEELLYGILASHRRLILATITRLVLTGFILTRLLLSTIARLFVSTIHGNLSVVRAGIQCRHRRSKAQNYQKSEYTLHNMLIVNLLFSICINNYPRSRYRRLFS